MKRKTPTILIIVGITGDLASRKLLPALGQILEREEMPDDFQIVGITRKPEVDIDALLTRTDNKNLIRDRLTIFSMDVNQASEYERLVVKLEEIESGFETPAERTFYLSVPPTATGDILEHLGESGLSANTGTKILLEKPFGVDLASAETLFARIQKNIDVQQVYMIDHYLAKKIAYDIIATRKNNPTFENTWNKDSVDRIEIILSETIGIEGRAQFYEETGALRDVVENHALEIAALALMGMENDTGMQTKRAQALKSLRIASPLKDSVIRGQYKGYRGEVGNMDSTVETFASLTLASDDPRWLGVPISLIAGKMLDRQANEVRVYYKTESSTQDILPFSHVEATAPLPEAYERIILGAMDSDTSLFTSKEEVLESWRIVAPVQEAWADNREDLVIYEQGSNHAIIQLARLPDKI